MDGMEVEHSATLLPTQYTLLKIWEVVTLQQVDPASAGEAALRVAHPQPRPDSLGTHGDILEQKEQVGFCSADEFVAYAPADLLMLQQPASNQQLRRER